MSVALTTTYENSYFRRSIGGFSETASVFHPTNRSAFITRFEVLTARRVRHITSPLWRPASTECPSGKPA